MGKMDQIIAPKLFDSSSRNRVERRRTTRMLIEIPVTLATSDDLHTCHMTNISDAGALLETPMPPSAGTRARIVMGDEVVQCEVIWRRHQTCGIKFEHNLGNEKLGTIASENSKAKAEAERILSSVRTSPREHQKSRFWRKLPSFWPLKG